MVPPKLDIDIKKSKMAGPLLYGWARRTKHGLPSTQRQIQALNQYLPTAPAEIYKALGGHLTRIWVKSLIDQVNTENYPNEQDQITVLGLPYGGPIQGKDLEGQYFSPMTEFFDGLIDEPPVYYTHGATNGFEPTPIGTVQDRWYDQKGGWFNIQLDPSSDRYQQLQDAHQNGTLKASTGVVPASATFDPVTGHINTWLVGELSLVDTRDGYEPVNSYAITKAFQLNSYYGDTMDPEEQDEADAQVALEQATKLMQSSNPPQNKIMSLIKVALSKLISATTTENQPEPVDTQMKSAASNFGGMKRSDIPVSDYVFPPSKDDPNGAFPIVVAADVTDAVHSWGQYKGPESFDTFKQRVIDIATRLGLESNLPKDWTAQKCQACDEAAQLAEQYQNELNPAQKCQKCPEAVQWAHSMLKAGKIAPLEAGQFYEQFSTSDEQYEIIKAEVESRTTLGLSKAQQDDKKLSVAGGSSSNKETSIDQEHMNRQRKLLGLPVK